MKGNDGSGRPSGRSPEDITLTATGITLLGVLLSVGATVGFGVGGEWWVRILAGVATSLLLVRTFLSFTLEVELEGRWPWQRRSRSEPAA